MTYLICWEISVVSINSVSATMLSSSGVKNVFIKMTILTKRISGVNIKGNYATLCLFACLRYKLIFYPYN